MLLVKKGNAITGFWKKRKIQHTTFIKIVGSFRRMKNGHDYKSARTMLLIIKTNGKYRITKTNFEQMRTQKSKAE